MTISLLEALLYSGFHPEGTIYKINKAGDKTGRGTKIRASQNQSQLETCSDALKGMRKWFSCIVNTMDPKEQILLLILCETLTLAHFPFPKCSSLVYASFLTWHVLFSVLIHQR